MLLPGAWLCPLLADTGPQKKATKAGYIIWEPQITSGDQFSFNSVHTDYSVPYTNLIDGDVNTYFHSVWGRGRHEKRQHNGGRMGADTIRAL